MVRLLTLTLLAGLAAAISTMSAHAADHPRLLLGKDEVPALREKVRREPFASMLARMKADASLGAESTPGPVSSDFDYQMLTSRNAFLYLVTGDDRYAQESRKAVEKLFTFRKWGVPNVKGLSLYTAGVYVALAYDMCYGAPSWDKEFSDRISKELLKQHEVIYSNGGTEQNGSPASNWQGLRWSSAGITLMATDEPVEEAHLKACQGRVTQYLVANMGGNPGTRGWNIEGLGYTFYPMGNGVLQYVIAAKRRDPGLDLTQLPGLRMTLWTTYASLVPTSHGLLRPDFGDDNPQARGEGCYGFAFATCPAELIPGIKYWYDRTVGIKGDKTFDNARFGTASSILYYPDKVVEKDPMTIPAWRDALVDTAGNGMMVYRNHYKDSTDIVAQFYAKLRGNMGHNGPDALSFRIVGMDTIWAAGGGRYGAKTNGQDVYLRSMNTLYPADPDGPLKISAQPGKIMGTPLLKPDGGGHVVARIGTNNLGVSNHQRWFITDFSQRSGAEAAFIVCDTSDNGGLWQFCTLETNKITTAGNTFTVTDAAGDSLKGTVLYPAGPVNFKTGTRPRGSDAGTVKNNNFITFPSADGCYVVAMSMVKRGQIHPVASASGTWGKTPKGSVTIGKFAAGIDGDLVSYPAGQ